MFAAIFGETKEATGLEASDVVAFMAAHQTVGARENVNEVLPLFHDNCTLRVDNNVPGISNEFLDLNKKFYKVESGMDFSSAMMFDTSKFAALMEKRKENPDTKLTVGAVVKITPRHYIRVRDFIQPRDFDLKAVDWFRYLNRTLIDAYPGDLKIVNDIIEFLPDFMGFIVRY